MELLIYIVAAVEESIAICYDSRLFNARFHSFTSAMKPKKEERISYSMRFTSEIRSITQVSIKIEI